MHKIFTIRLIQKNIHILQETQPNTKNTFISSKDKQIAKTRAYSQTNSTTKYMDQKQPLEKHLQDIAKTTPN